MPKATRVDWNALWLVSCSALLAGRPPRPTVWRDAMEMALTAVFKKVAEGYIGFVEELPGANTQGATLEEARENLREAVELVLEANRALAREEAGDGEVIREPLKIAAG
jgi:predicted RNase H-like HicB family nuclease